MPFLEGQAHVNPTVEAVTKVIHDLLDRAVEIKPAGTLEPPLNKANFDDLPDRLSRIIALEPINASNAPKERKKSQRFATIETSARRIFSRLVSALDIESPNFITIWNLFDILSMIADNGDCDPGILFWLIEELLDSQTISNCRKVFDYLESRRERSIARHFNNVKLIVLRSCNDLLRRLSRAEDTPFCGRVFIFLFQVFPLGDKSSVNPRGEYHVENVTTYEESPTHVGEGGGDKMDVDTPAAMAAESKTKDAKDREVLSPEALYPMFWSLQTSFSQPKKLFDAAHFAHFKVGLEATLAAFKQIQKEQGSRSSKQSDEPKRDNKRKREESDEDFVDAYNPKYLTSPDLFQLETSDLTFRRHFLVQALIIMDFLLSLTPKSRDKLDKTGAQSKSVMYLDHVLSDDDEAWVNKMKLDITEHIKLSENGLYFHRMIDTILARDKNWVRWKIEQCPSIEIGAITSQEFADAQESARRAFSNKRIRPVPMGSLSLDFLQTGDDASVLNKFRKLERYAIPELGSFQYSISEEDYEIEVPKDGESNAEAEERKASKSWRVLRVASRSRLAAFDQVDGDNDINAIFSNGEPSGEKPRKPDSDSLPTDTRPVVISGTPRVGKRSLVEKLMERNEGVFGHVLQHTTRPTEDGGRYHSVDSKSFNVMLDGDKLIESSEVDGQLYGTNLGLVDAVKESGRVPIVVMAHESVQAAKDMGYCARNVFIQPPSLGMLGKRLRDEGREDGEVQAVLKRAVEAMEYAKREGVFDKVITNEELPAACEELEAYIYAMVNGNSAEEEAAGAPMKDTVNGDGQG